MKLYLLHQENELDLHKMKDISKAFVLWVQFSNFYLDVKICSSKNASLPFWNRTWFSEPVFVAKCAKYIAQKNRRKLRKKVGK